MTAARAVALAAALLAGLAACASSPVGRTPPAGPTGAWRLVEIQSMDDAQGSTRPRDPSAYTLKLQSDGRFSMRLDCNRATGGWTATPAADAASGPLTFSGVAVTRALCPPPSLEARIARDLDYVRSYRLVGGRLALSLMADGGIYLWEPDPGDPGR